MAIIAAIAAKNTGTVIDCYAIWDKKNKSAKTLVSSDMGRLRTSALIEKGYCTQIYDSKGGLNTDYPIQKTSDIKNLGFDTKSIWEYAGTDTPVGFQGNGWHVKASGKAENTIHIKSVDDYIAFADKVNEGDRKIISANVYLDCDLDFKGRNIPIIGKTRDTAFTGTFDGRDHLIWNGTIKDESALYTAMFGYLKGTVINLIFDGRVESDKNLAGLCGLNMGTVSCCGIVVRLKPKDDRSTAGGIVTVNEGTIDRSYALLARQIIIPPIVYILIIALVAIILGIIGYFTVITALNIEEDYAKIEVDPGQFKNPDNFNGTNGENALAFSLYKTVQVSRGSRTARVNFTNPSNDENKLVVELQVVNSAGERITVGKSKAVMPGYSINSIAITNMSALTGSETEGYIVLTAYNIKTEAKAMLETELPVTIIYSD